MIPNVVTVLGVGGELEARDRRSDPGPNLINDQGLTPMISLVFALYPGGWGRRDTCLCSHRKSTEVHIFYGDRDDIETYDGTLSACRSLARWRRNIAFHLLKGATHAYDDTQFFTFHCCGGKPVSVDPNPKAVEETRAIITEAIKTKWQL